MHKHILIDSNRRHIDGTFVFQGIVCIGEQVFQAGLGENFGTNLLEYSLLVGSVKVYNFVTWRILNWSKCLRRVTKR